MIYAIAFFVCASVFLCSPQPGRAEFRLLLIHNNDMHSRFEETNAYGAPCKRNQCYGGFARMKTAIEMAKEEAKRDGIPYLVINAGDTFQGSPYYDALKGNIVQPLLESLSIDVMVSLITPSLFVCMYRYVDCGLRVENCVSQSGLIESHKYQSPRGSLVTSGIIAGEGFPRSVGRNHQARSKAISAQYVPMVPQYLLSLRGGGL